MSQEISIDEAIETIDRFVEHHENTPQDVPLLSLENFKLHNGVIRVEELSKLETTLARLMESVSKQKRQAKQHEKKSVRTILLRSIDAIQIALIKFAHSKEGNHKEGNQELEARLQTVAQRYNCIVNRSKIQPTTPFQRVKHYFYKSIGWLLDEEFLENRFHFPAEQRRKYSTALCGNTSKKIASLVGETGPLKQELELFFAKAHTLLRQQNLPQNILKDALTSIRSHPIETSVSSDALVSMQLPLSLLPGEELLMVGAFSRGKALSVPIKESFKIIAKATQTGYPHPLQSTGFALTELLLPTLLLRPPLAKKVDRLLKKKQQTADWLMPGGKLNEKAKAQLQIRKELFQKHKEELLPQQKALEHALFGDAGCPPHFNTLLDDALLAVREKWLHNGVKTKNQLEEIFLQELRALPPRIGEAITACGLLVYSEKVGFHAPLLNPFAKKLLGLVFLELEAFLHELEEIPAEEKAMEVWLKGLVEKKVQFVGAKEMAHPLVSELESYYVLRGFHS